MKHKKRCGICYFSDAAGLSVHSILNFENRLCPSSTGWTCWPWTPRKATERGRSWGTRTWRKSGRVSSGGRISGAENTIFLKDHSLRIKIYNNDHDLHREPPSGQKSCSQNLTLPISDDTNLSQKTWLIQFLMTHICVKTMQRKRVWSSCLDTHLCHREWEESSCNQKWLHVVLGHQEATWLKFVSSGIGRVKFWLQLFWPDGATCVIS